MFAAINLKCKTSRWWKHKKQMHIKRKMAASQRMHMDPFNLNQWTTKDEYKQQELDSLTNGLCRIVKAFEPKLLLSDQLVKIRFPSHFYSSIIFKMKRELTWCNMEYSSMYSYHQHCMEVSDQLLTLPRWAPGTQWRGSWGDPRSTLKVLDNRSVISAWNPTVLSWSLST